MKNIALASLAAGLMLAACTDAPTGVFGGPNLSQAGGAAQVRVMTQNLYVGTDVDTVLAALMTPSQDDDLAALTYALNVLARTDFPARAGAIADEIAREQPHVVGFQEVSEIHVDLSAIGGPVVHLEFLPIIQAQLAARGLHYTVAAINQNLDASPAPGFRLVDYDAILVNTDLASIDFTHAQTFSLNLVDLIGEVGGVALRRGFVEVAATIEGTRYWFVSTHPEPNLGPYDLAELRAAQIAEVAAVLGAAPRAIVMGDLNDTPGSLEYGVLRQAGFHDTWAELRPEEDGFTAGTGYSPDRPPDLSNAKSAFNQRIDYVWARGVGHPSEGLQGRITRFGVLPSDRVEGAYGLIWPSDHAGLVAQLNTPVAAGIQ